MCPEPGIYPKVFAHTNTSQSPAACLFAICHSGLNLPSQEILWAQLTRGKSTQLLMKQTHVYCWIKTAMWSNLKAKAELSSWGLCAVTYHWTHGLSQFRFVEHPLVTQVLQVFRISNDRVEMKEVLKEVLTMRHTRLQLLQAKTRVSSHSGFRKAPLFELVFE